MAYDPMIAGKVMIVALAAALAVAALAEADMMPVSQPDAGHQQSVSVSNSVNLQCTNPPNLFVYPAVFNPDLRSVGYLPGSRAEVGQASGTKPPHILTDEQNSLTLGLYALLGLGVCRSAPYLKKLHFGHIPDWCHTGGPYQIGHNFAVSPDRLCPAPACCFIQPDRRVEDPISQYRWKAVVCLWRTSQFTAATLAARGPPCMS